MFKHEILKKLVTGITLLLVIIAITLWALAKSIKPETVKSYVSSQLSTLTERKSLVNGDISWQVFPRPGIKITGVQIGNENDNANYSVKLENLLFHLKITPLLRGKLVFSELNVDGFRITINPDSPQPPAKVKKNKQNSNTTKTNNMTEEFAIERFLLSRGQIVIVQNQKKITFSGLQIGAEQFNLQKNSFPLQLKTMLDMSEANESLLKAHINFKGSTALSASLFNNPVIALQNLPLEGQLSLQDVRLKKLKINKISANAKTKIGVFHLNPLTLNLYNGQSVGDLSYEFASKKLTVNQTATNLDSSKLLYDLVKKRLFKGSVDFSIHAQTNMQDSNWPEHTSGNGSLTIKDGVVESINLDRVIDETSNKINKLMTSKKKDAKQTLELGQFEDPSIFKGNTRFELLTFQYQLQDSTLQSNSLVLQAEKLQLKGEGILNLKDYNLDSHLFAKVALNDEKVEKFNKFWAVVFLF
ncbi:AsmA family protein [Legionella tunisiensis]|uniref:AsmA family protein n=1 Tax=Legionella tunisiensis TaxID=1034944 RepID=UPI0002F366D9|nr:AsmA family protein [Legionella tunisiensis]